MFLITFPAFANKTTKSKKEQIFNHKSNTSFFPTKLITIALNFTNKPNGVQELGTHRREGVAGIRNQQASFTHSSVTNRDALNKPRSAHFVVSFPILTILTIEI
jgi:hypothetical protein